MKKLIAIFVFIFLLTTPVKSQGIIDDIQQNLVRIHASGPNNRWKTCTAFVIEKGWGVTAEHCVTTDEGFDLKILDDQRRKITVFARSITSGFNGDDIAILTGEIFKETPGLTLSDNIPDLGEDVYAMGFADGTPFPFLVKSSIARKWDPFYFSLQDGVLPGMSGGPVVDTNGNVVGVISRGNYGATQSSGSEHIQELFGRIE